MKEIRIAVIGWGFMGRTHTHALRAIPLMYQNIDFKPVLKCVCSRREEPAKKAMEDLGFERYTTDWKTLVNDPEIDAVSICTPNELHEEMAIAFLNAGKHVYIDKPLAVTNESAMRIMEAAKSSSSLTQMVMNNRFLPATMRARQLYEEGALGHVYNTQPELGAISNILPSAGLCFCPAETDMSIRKGWFWHAEEDPHSLERLKRTYMTSAGGNSALNLNIPPDRRGLIDERDVKRLKELGDWLRSAFGNAINGEKTVTGPAHRPVYEISFPEKRRVGYIVLGEDIAEGQRVETFIVSCRDEYGQWSAVYNGTTIGNRRIVKINKNTDAVQVKITFARGDVSLKNISVYEEAEE